MTRGRKLRGVKIMSRIGKDQRRIRGVEWPGPNNHIVADDGLVITAYEEAGQGGGVPAIEITIDGKIAERVILGPGWVIEYDTEETGS
jgi:hypothetical protein